jgi:hypothetical protein
MTAREPVSGYDEAASDDAPKNSQSRLRIR